MAVFEGRSRVRRPTGSVDRRVWWVAALALLSGIVYLMATADTGPRDPTEATHAQNHGTVVFNSAMIVFREGLEAVLILAAVTASFLGANRSRRRPVMLGAATSFGATVVTWFVAQAVLDAASSLGPKLEAITGFLAIIVLLLVLNWFVHKVYWSEWIGKHHRQRKKLLARSGPCGHPGPGCARLHERLSRRLRGRALPAEPRADCRLGHGA
jgi:high-affinity iron transporter